MKTYLLAAAAVVTISSGASATDLLSKKILATVPATMSKLHEWNGSYFGINAGFLNSNSDITHIYFDGYPSPGDDGQLDMNGNLIGGQLGYNYQTGNIILGLEGDFAFTNVTGNHLFEFGGNPVMLDGQLKSIGTVRARFGYAIDQLLIFVTGGFAYASTEAKLTSIVPPVITASGSQSYSGYTIGGGVEYGLNKNWSAKAEYLYADFGKRSHTYVFTSDVAQAAADTSLESNILRIGLNYKY